MRPEEPVQYPNVRACIDDLNHTYGTKFKFTSDSVKLLAVQNARTAKHPLVVRGILKVTVTKAAKSGNVYDVQQLIRDPNKPYGKPWDHDYDLCDQGLTVVPGHWLNTPSIWEVAGVERPTEVVAKAPAGTGAERHEAQEAEAEAGPGEADPGQEAGTEGEGLHEAQDGQEVTEPAAPGGDHIGRESIEQLTTRVRALLRKEHDLRLSAGYVLIELKARITDKSSEEGKPWHHSWRTYVQGDPKHGIPAQLERSTRDADRLIGYAKSEDPEAAIEADRKASAGRTAATRAEPQAATVSETYVRPTSPSPEEEAEDAVAETKEILKQGKAYVDRPLIKDVSAAAATILSGFNALLDEDHSASQLATAVVEFEVTREMISSAIARLEEILQALGEPPPGGSRTGDDALKHEMRSRVFEALGATPAQAKEAVDKLSTR